MTVDIAYCVVADNVRGVAEVTCIDDVATFTRVNVVHTNDVDDVVCCCVV